MFRSFVIVCAYLMTRFVSVAPIVRRPPSRFRRLSRIGLDSNPLPRAAALRRRYRDTNCLQSVVYPWSWRGPGVQSVDERLQFGTVGIVKSFQELIVPRRHFAPFVIEHRRELFVDLSHHLAHAAVNLHPDVIAVRRPPALLYDANGAIPESQQA